MTQAMISKESITAVVLSGGRGQRMGGLDKGLQAFCGMPLAQWALQRIAPQVGRSVVNANRHLEQYANFGVPVVPDRNDVGEYAGPLAGVLAALEVCATPYLLTVPCDTPLFPLDLATRLSDALAQADADFAVAYAWEEDGALRSQPVFCLMRADLRESLLQFMQTGGRKVAAWTAQHRCVQVAFNLPGDDPRAFFNANTLPQLQQLEADSQGQPT